MGFLLFTDEEGAWTLRTEVTGGKSYTDVLWSCGSQLIRGAQGLSAPQLQLPALRAGGLDDRSDSRDHSGHLVGNLNQEDVFDDYHGVPPVNPRLRSVPDVHHNENKDEAAVVIDQTTIDLTNSPPRITRPLLLSPSASPLVSFLEMSSVFRTISIYSPERV